MIKKTFIFVLIIICYTETYAVSDTIETIDVFKMLNIDTSAVNNTELSELYIKDSSIYFILDNILSENRDSLIFYDMSFSLYSDTTGELFIQKCDDALYYLNIFYGYIDYKNNYFFVSMPRYREYYNRIFEKSDNKKRFCIDWDKFEFIDNSPNKTYKYEFVNTHFMHRNSSSANR